jgi:Type I phosphodiesterase / nucleotide pyrophosphatase
MGYARHIGRIGALAVTLGVGFAIATTPGIAFAQPTDTDPGTTNDTTTTQVTTKTGAQPIDKPHGFNLPGSKRKANDTTATQVTTKTGAKPIDMPHGINMPGSKRKGSVEENEDPADEDLVDAEDDENTTKDGAAQRHRFLARLADMVDDTVKGAVDRHSDDRRLSRGNDEPTLTVNDGSDDLDASFTADGLQAQAFSIAEESNEAVSSFLGAPAFANVVTTLAGGARTAATAAVSRPAARTAPAARASVVNVVSDLVSSLVELGSGTGSPLHTPLLFTVLAFARREFGDFARNYTAQQNAPQQQENVLYVDEADLDATLAALAADPNTHVLLIGVNGTNLSAILADDYNQEFFDLMNDGTTGAATITGHTTISNPSWTAMLTGVQSETAGVSNNVFTPWTYDTWPTVYNQLEAVEDASGAPVHTTSIADWVVQSHIAGAGGPRGADTVLYVQQIGEGWEATDDEVGELSVDAIDDTVPGEASFQFTYFVGVDNTGHDTYGGSPEYQEALRNVNDNIGLMMDAVDAWEAANPGETFTVIVVTDHGQSDRLHLGAVAHGFQTPIETTTFVIAEDKNFVTGVSENFEQGAVNNTYRNVDVTPTVMALFGIAPEPYFAGVPLMDKAASTYRPVDDPDLTAQESLRLALEDALGMYGYPDIATNVRLSVRTIATIVPDQVFALFNGLIYGGQLPGFLVTPVTVVGIVVYQSTNIPAQIIARLTGVTGNQIIPPDLNPFLTPPTPVNPPTSTLTTLDFSHLGSAGGLGSAA